MDKMMPCTPKANECITYTSFPWLLNVYGYFVAVDDDEDGDVPKKEAGKKKKKKAKSKETAQASSTAAAASKNTGSKPAKKDDLSMAILKKNSGGRNSLKVFNYGGTKAAEVGHSVVGMTEESLLSLGLFEGDTISIKGKRGKSTIASIAVVSSSDVTDAVDGAAASPKDKSGKQKLDEADSDQVNYLGMSSDALKNAGVRAGDTVTITPAPDVKFGKAVLVLPYADSLKAVGGVIPTKSSDEEEDSEEGVNSFLFDDYLKPYFAGKFRTLYRGDSFSIDGPRGQVDFKCVEIDSVEVDSDTSCIVVDDTTIEYDGEPIDRSDELDDLDNAGYDMIGGASKHLAAVRELVELPLRHPELWRKLGINPPRGVLLTGPSGSGKTAMARAVAAETGAYFFVINGPEVISKRAGESETNLRRAFEDAESNADDYNGAIIFIDELDSIAPKREQASGEVEKRIVSQLLTLMDGLKPTSKVVVMAATNRPGVIEPALRRPGRFDRELDMGIPDEQGRLEILQIKTRDMRLGENVDLEIIARNTHGYVGADLQQLCMEAALECIREKMGLIDFDKDRVDKTILDTIVVEEKHFDHALGIVAPSSLRENQVEVPDVHWEDVGGLEDVKRELHETVQYPVEHADKYLKFGMSPSKGVLFYGPPGCGKTLLAKVSGSDSR
jgi:transitional endoplasmic reticulum ATPase